MQRPTINNDCITMGEAIRRAEAAVAYRRQAASYCAKCSAAYGQPAFHPGPACCAKPSDGMSIVGAGDEDEPQTAITWGEWVAFWAVLFLAGLGIGAIAAFALWLLL